MMEANVNLDVYIEHLQEMGFVCLMNDTTPVFVLVDLLKQAGYDTKYNQSKDRLELVK